MTNYTFRVNLDSITKLECFKDASKDELKVLVAILALDGAPTSAEDLANDLGISVARVKATVTLFEESGVLIAREKSDFLAEVEYEFELRKNEKSTSNLQVAASIRDNNLRDLYKELEILLEKTLESRESARIYSLYEKGLSLEYILDLTAFLKDTRKQVTVEAIVREANKLLGKNIDNHEALSVYISEKSKEIKGEYQVRGLFGIYDRNLSSYEREYFKKWLHEYGYSLPIINEAYNITVAVKSKIVYSYIDAILTAWYNSGCKTLEECKAKSEMIKHENFKNANNSSQKSKKNVEADTPKYTEFNSEDALLRALERSYGDSDSK
jgi:DnaD/phage-associated family protein